MKKTAPKGSKMRRGGNSKNSATRGVPWGGSKGRSRYGNKAKDFTTYRSVKGVKGREVRCECTPKWGFRRKSRQENREDARIAKFSELEDGP